MNSIRHLLRKDWLARRFHILMWFVFIGLGLLSDLGLPNADSSDPNGPQSAIYVIWAPLLYIFSAALAVFIILPTMREDSPAVRESFVATRPIHPRALWISKALFLLLVIVFPLLLSNAIYLILNGRGARTLLLGTLQTALWVVPVTALTAAFVSLWATKFRLGAAFAVCMAVAWGAVIGAEFLQWHRFRGDNSFTDPLNFISAIGWAALAFVLLTTSRRFFRLPLRVKLLPAVFISLAGLAYFFFGPVPIRSTSPGGTLPNLAATGELSPAESGFQFSLNEDHRGPDRGHTLGLTLIPDRPAGLQPNQEILWQITETTANSEIQRHATLSPEVLLSRFDLTRILGNPMINAVEKHLDRELLWMNRRNHPRSTYAVSIPGVDLQSNTPLKTRAKLDGRIFEWQVAADLPLRPGATVGDEYEKWTMVGLTRTVHEPFLLTVRAARTHLWLSSRSEERSCAIMSPSRDVAYLLYDPKNGRGYAGLEPRGVSSRAPGTAYVHRSINLTLNYPFNRGRNLITSLGESPDDLRLLIVRPRYIGQISRQWVAESGIHPNSLPRPTSGGLARRERQLSSEQFELWFKRLEKPEPDASPAAISQFLVTVLDKAAQCRSGIRSGGPVVRDLARYVPDHLELFLRAKQSLAMDDHTPRRLLMEALTLGVTSAQRPSLVDGLRSDSRLLRILDDRGWSGDAVPVLLEKFHTGRRDAETLRILARHGKLAPYIPALLAELRRSPDKGTYDLLRTQPGVGPRLDTTVRAMWEDRLRAIKMDGPFDSTRLKIALRHGLVDAVEELHSQARITKELAPTELYNVARFLQDYFLLEGVARGDRHEDQIVVPWFLARSPELFRFDPISRRFAYVQPST